jgi:hypothetical protein
VINLFCYMEHMEVRATLEAFDGFLAERRLRFEAVIVGGAALNLLGIVHRPTRDCDVLCPPLTPQVAAAAAEFAGLRGLPRTWINDGPSSRVRELPAGWEARLQDAFRSREGELLERVTGGGPRPERRADPDLVDRVTGGRKNAGETPPVRARTRSRDPGDRER